MPLQQLTDAQVNPEVPINENFEVLGAYAVYAKRADTTSGLTWGYYGGRWGGFEVTEGQTLTLSANSTNYLVVARSTGAQSVSTSDTNWNDQANYARVYRITTATAAVSTVQDHRLGDRGIIYSDAIERRTTYTVDAITAVNATTLGLVDGDVVVARGRSAAGDGGGSTFDVRESAQAADGGTVFDLGSGFKAFREGWTVLGFNGSLRGAWFGMTGNFNDGANTGTANQTALQNMLTAAGDFGGGRCVVHRTQAGGDFLLTAQVRQPSNTTLVLDNGVTLWRGWNSVGSNKGNATIINENHLVMNDFVVDPGPYDWEADTVDENIHIEGPGGFDVTSAIRADTIANSKFAGPHVSFVGVFKCSVRGTNGKVASRDWALHFIANEVEVSGNTLVGGTQVFEDGIHFLGGKGIRIFGNHVESGDDAIVFGGGYNLACSDVAVGINTGFSTKGHFYRVLQYREGVTAAFAPSTEYVERMHFSGPCRGGLQRNAALRIDTNSTAPLMVRDITFDLEIEQGNLADHDLSNAQAVIFMGGDDIRLRGSIKNPIRQALLLRQGATNIRVEATIDKPQAAGFQPVDISACGTVTLEGHITCNDRPGVIANNVSNLTVGKLEVIDIPTGYSGMRLQGPVTVNFTGGYRPVKASGATTTAGFAVESGTINVQRQGDDLTGVDRVYAPTVAPATYVGARSSGSDKTQTIASGAVSYRGESSIGLLGEGGLSDTVASLTNAPDGTEVVLFSGEAVPATVVVTVTAGTGANNFNIGTNYALDTAAKGLRIRRQNGVWQQIARW